MDIMIAILFVSMKFLSDHIECQTKNLRIYLNLYDQDGQDGYCP